MSPEEAVALVNKFAHDDEVDRLVVEILRSPSPQTDRLEADPGVRDFVASIVAPRIESLTGQPPKLDSMGNLLWVPAAPTASRTGGFLLMAYAMTYPPASMSDPYSGAVVSGAPFQISGPRYRSYWRWPGRVFP